MLHLGPLLNEIVAIWWQMEGILPKFVGHFGANGGTLPRFEGHLSNNMGHFGPAGWGAWPLWPPPPTGSAILPKGKWTTGLFGQLDQNSCQSWDNMAETSPAQLLGILRWGGDKEQALTVPMPLLSTNVPLCPFTLILTQDQLTHVGTGPIYHMRVQVSYQW